LTKIIINQTKMNSCPLWELLIQIPCTVGARTTKQRTNPPVYVHKLILKKVSRSYLGFFCHGIKKPIRPPISFSAISEENTFVIV